MESLSPECTPLKNAYDSCFNLWFEGYLQPALDAAQTSSASGFSSIPSSYASTPSTSSSTTASSSSSTSTPSDGAPDAPPRIITSWANAFRSRVAPPAPATETPVDSQDSREIQARAQTASAAPLPPIDTRGKTRAQIKAEEYERNCGAQWQAYQTCLQRGIAENMSLSELLQAARNEHPLRDQNGLEGTAWDTKGTPKDAD